MTVSERISTRPLEPLPPEAGDVNAPRFEPNGEWLRRAPSQEQEMAMWRWFATRYDDPALAMPHDDDGNYLMKKRRAAPSFFIPRGGAGWAQPGPGGALYRWRAVPCR
jgi:hypothetical protein